MTRARKLKISSILAGSLVFAIDSTAFADQQFDADKVMKEMDEVQRYTYLAGVIEGLAVARYMKDGKQSAGMNCIYDWFYDDKSTVDTIYAAFRKYGTYPPGSVVDVLAKQKCGE
ncbi:hypothetical protein DEM27_16205 [Metarhizobium album]|uniref:Rap1a immunity protein domain-containing protein n=1 Tax=Metarhizobium album TaxID=2182425 RepID=A0A2U2DNU9_9HYPH|nr:hypothetical protein [Rhizobium album]PWE54998.1 hypothetical protein DEM27_16205 [Rhizobium album]